MFCGHLLIQIPDDNWNNNDIFVAIIHAYCIYSTIDFISTTQLYNIGEDTKYLGKYKDFKLTSFQLCQ